MSTIESPTATLAAPTLPVALGERVDVQPVIDHLTPIIRSFEKQIDIDRRLPEELVEALYDAGIFHSQTPHERGGRELHPVDRNRLIYELARVNGSVAWVAMIQGGSYPIFEDALVEELAPDGRLLVAGSHGRIGDARKVDGGYLFTGRWAFASGAAWATHLTGSARIVDENGAVIPDPETGADQLVEGVFPLGDVEYIDDWNPLGMRGSASAGFSLQDYFVPDAHMVGGGIPERFLDRPLFRTYSIYGQLNNAVLVLGTAQATIDEFAAIVAQKRARASYAGRASKLGHQQLHQIRIAEESAKIRSALDWVTRLAEEDYAAAAAGIPLDYETGVIDMQLATLHSARVAKEVASTLFDLAGTDSVAWDSRLCRAFRDTMTGTQHSLFLETEFVPLGQYVITKDSPEGPRFETETFLPAPPPREA